jgi:hypothetical protein
MALPTGLVLADFGAACFNGTDCVHVSLLLNETGFVSLRALAR